MRLYNLGNNKEGYIVSQSRPQPVNIGAEISSLVDNRILQPGGALLGSVDELLIDLRSGRITHIIARCRNGQRRAIPWHLVECRDRMFRLRSVLPPPIAQPAHCLEEPGATR